MAKMTKEILEKEYSGNAFLTKIDPLILKLVLANREYMKLAFGENVEYERLFERVAEPL